jgi:hypothetical protein
VTTPQTYPPNADTFDANTTPVIRLRLTNGPRDYVAFFKGWHQQPDGTIVALTTPHVNSAYWYGDSPTECSGDIKRLKHITGAMVFWSDVETEYAREDDALVCRNCCTPMNMRSDDDECITCRVESTHLLLQNNVTEVD